MEQNSDMEKVKYPELKVLLERRFEEWWRKSGRKDKMPNVRGLAKKIHEVTGTPITHSSLHDWRLGNAKPHPEKVDALAKFFAPDSTDEQEQIKAAIKAATTAAETLVDPIDVVDSHARPLRVGVIHFPLFCQLKGKNKDEPDGFLDALVKHFLSFSSLERNQAEFIEIPLDKFEEMLCNTGEVDLVIGLFVEPSRLRNLWFYRDLPILIPLDGVRAKAVDDPKKFRGAMTTLNNFAALKSDVIPIVDPKELGGIYVTQFLGFNSDYKKVEYRLSNYAEELIELSTSGTSRVPVCVIDEVSCCLVRKMVRNSIAESSNDKVSLNDIALLSEGPDGTHVFPRYRYGMAIARQHSGWKEYFAESFELFIESNTELVSQLYFELYQNLLKDLSESSEPLIRKWLSLNPDKSHNISCPWEAVITATIKTIENLQASSGRPSKGNASN
jgi:hypothetical protein